MSTSPSTPVSSTGRRMAFAGSLLAGGIAIGSLFSPMALAGAQDDGDTSVESTVEESPSDATTTDATASDGEVGERRHRGARHFAESEVLQDLLGLTADELVAAREEGSTLVAIAADQGVSETELVSALVSEATTRIADAVEAGDLDADRAAMITENLEERITERVNRVPGEHDGQGRRGGIPGRGFDGSALTDLGIDVEVLREAMVGGSTLAEAAAAQGVGEDDLVAALTAEAAERLADAVESGRIDEDKAAELEADIAERVESSLDGSRLGSGGRGGRHGMSDDADPDA